MKPDYLILGAQKCGTTSLKEYIRQHPDEGFNCARKEIGYFSEHWVEDIDWYEDQFPIGHTVGEKCPEYLFYPKVPNRVASTYPDLKLIVLLRDPVDRAYSQYWHNYYAPNYADRETRSFRDAVQGKDITFEDWDNLTETINHYSYTERGQYAWQIRRWLKHFDISQFHFIKSEDFFVNTQEEFDRACAFLGSQSYIIQPIPYLKQNYKPMPPKVRKSLQEYFKFFNDDLEELFEKYNVNFEVWEYEDI